MKKLILLIGLTFICFNQSYTQNNNVREIILDTNIKANFFDIKYLGNSPTHSEHVIVGWDYNGGSIYKLVEGNLPTKFELLLEAEDKYFFCSDVLVTQGDIDNTIFVGGYLSKCMCGILLKQKKGIGIWEEIVFDDLDNPYVSNILTIAKNKISESSDNDFNRIFLGCSNGVIFFSDDSAAAFQKASINAGNEAVTKIEFVNESIGFALAGDNLYYQNKIYKTTDNGSSWFEYFKVKNKTHLINDFTVISVSDDELILFLAGSDGKNGLLIELAEKDGIVDYSEIPRASESTLQNTSLVGVHLESDDSGWIVDENGVLYTVEDRVYTEWSKIESENNPAGPIQTLFVNKTTSISYAVGKSGRLIKFFTDDK